MIKKEVTKCSDYLWSSAAILLFPISASIVWHFLPALTTSFLPPQLNLLKVFFIPLPIALAVSGATYGVLQYAKANGKYDLMKSPYGKILALGIINGIVAGVLYCITSKFNLFAIQYTPTYAYHTISLLLTSVSSMAILSLPAFGAQQYMFSKLKSEVESNIYLGTVVQLSAQSSWIELDDSNKDKQVVSLANVINPLSNYSDEIWSSELNADDRNEIFTHFSNAHDKLSSAYNAAICLAKLNEEQNTGPYIQRANHYEKSMAILNPAMSHILTIKRYPVPEAQPYGTVILE